MARAKVKWFNDQKGFGFLIDANLPEDIFVHYSVILGDGYKTLAEGEEVEYELLKDGRGAKASQVIRINLN